MIRLIVILLNLLLFTKLFGQKAKIESLVNQAYKEIVPNNFEYYNLIDTSFVTRFDKYSFEKYELDSLLQKYSDFPIDIFIQKEKDNLFLNWATYNLDKAKVYSYENIPKFESQVRFNRLIPFNTSQQTIDSLKKTKKYNEVIIPIKKHWSKKRIDKEIKKVWTNYSNSIKIENKIYFFFSTPIIVDNYAIITLNQTGRGATHIFKKEGDIWKEIFVFERWIS